MSGLCKLPSACIYLVLPSLISSHFWHMPQTKNLTFQFLLYTEIEESRAICRYISEKHANQGNTKLYGTNPLEKASIDQWLEAEGQNFNPPTSALVFQLAFAPRMKIKQDEALIKQSKAKLTKVLDVYEKRLGESRYLAGDDFSLADLSHLPNSQYLVNGTDVEELFMSRENVGRWWGDISSRESWRKVVALQRAPTS